MTKADGWDETRIANGEEQPLELPSHAGVSSARERIELIAEQRASIGTVGPLRGDMDRTWNRFGF